MSRAMKDSGVEWIGLIPDDWSIVKLYNIKDRTNPYPIGDGDHGQIKPTMYLDAGIPYIRVQNLGWNKEINYKGMTYISESTHQKNLKSRLKPGDILIAKTGATVGKTAIIPDDIKEANTTSSVGKVSVNMALCDNNYIFYTLSSDSTQIQVQLTSSQKSAQPGFNIDDLVLFKIPFPSKKEQYRIGEFLDRRISHLDSIIDYTKSTIEDYKLLKQSIITEAVTKGLDRNMEMKDSGIDWIGEIPKHWTVNKLRYLGTLQNGISKGSDSFGTGTPFVSYSDIYKNYEVPSQVNGLVEATEKDMISYSVRKGDVFFTRTSETIQEIGLTSTCFHTIPEATFAGFLIRFRPLTENIFNNRYSKYYFRSDIHRRYFVKEMNLVTRASLSQGLLKNLTVLLPPFMEQQEIGEYLELKCGEIDLLIMQKTEMIKELEIYKKSLIFEYVTGKKEVL